MRILFVLLFALSMSANAVASWRMPHACCPEPACMTQCPAMHCAAASPAIAPPPAPLALTVVESVETGRQAALATMPSTVDEIWIPPD